MGELVVPWWVRENAAPRNEKAAKPERRRLYPPRIHMFRDEMGEPVMARPRWRFTDGTKEVTYRRPAVGHRDLSHPRCQKYAGMQGFWIPEKPSDAWRYLYRLDMLWPAVCDQVPEIVWTEGESDADALAVAVPGLTVTSHHGGAGKVYPAQADWFGGYDGRVLIAVDRDLPGAYDACKRWDLLVEAGLNPEQLEFRRAPEATGCKDVRDMLDAGHRWEDMEIVAPQALRVEAAQWTPAESRRHGYDKEWFEEYRAIFANGGRLWGKA
jgi:hypothetical protein